MRPCTILFLLLALASNGPLIAGSMDGNHARIYPAQISEYEVDGPPGPIGAGIQIAFLVLIISGPLLAIYCAIKKPVSFFLKRVSLGTLILWIAFEILILGLLLTDLFSNGHLRDFYDLSTIIIVVIFSVVTFSWIYVYKKTKVKSRDPEEKILIK
jgi:hypothetical protein